MPKISPDKPGSFDYTRVCFINAMISLGGKVEKNHASNDVWDLMVSRGFDESKLTRQSFPQSIRRWESEGWVGHLVDGRVSKCIEIYLDYIPDRLRPYIALSSDYELPPSPEAVPEPSAEFDVGSHVEEVALSLLEKVMAVATQQVPPRVAEDLARVLKEKQLLESELSSARTKISAQAARISNLEQQVATLDANCQKLAKERVVIRDDLGRQLGDLMGAPRRE